MRFDVLTLFPGMFDALRLSKIWQKAESAKLIQLMAHDLRDHGLGPHRSVDDLPFGGGAGMVLRMEPLVAGLEAMPALENRRVIFPSPGGQRLKASMLKRWSTLDQLVLVCGRYEGADQRFIDHYVDETVSMGDYVLSGGEIPAMAIMDGVMRFVDGVLGDSSCAQEDCFEDGKLKHPQYTRPADFHGLSVPEVLLGGNHAEIQAWRQEAAEARTRKHRPELLDKHLKSKKK